MCALKMWQLEYIRKKKEGNPRTLCLEEETSNLDIGVTQS